MVFLTICQNGNAKIMLDRIFHFSGGICAAFFLKNHENFFKKGLILLN